MTKSDARKHRTESAEKSRQRYPDTTGDYLNYRIGSEDDIFVRLQMILGKSKKQINQMLEKL